MWNESTPLQIQTRERLWRSLIFVIGRDIKSTILSSTPASCTGTFKIGTCLVQPDGSDNIDELSSCGVNGYALRSISLAKLSAPPLQSFYLLCQPAQQTCSLAANHFGLLHPFIERLRRVADLGRH
ncbi:hypothetical protein ASC96_18830 [Rhizobium sp. Root1204]|nr:hypothetical protein ASC96_18830 [Rhizobium sp. Root1204]